ncbi:MAG TPA: TlpA disulfide reductase family protein, partial [Planctomycetota bacterium]|nr:TlpA disulfide reductase family protein [Planctomycetota bacterium]
MRNTLAGLLLPVLLAAQEQPKKIEDFHFDGRTIGGQHLTQEAFRDGVLIVDLWGTWCPPCRAATPKLVALYEQY